MNRHVRGIMCMSQEVWLTKAKIPILSQHEKGRPFVEEPPRPFETQGDPFIRKEKDNVNRPHTVRLAKSVNIPPMSQLAVNIKTEASGLVFIEPKHSVLARHCVRTANGIAEVRGNRTFSIAISNLSEPTCMLPKNMAMGYATRNPMGIYCLSDEDSRAFESVLNLSFERKDAPQQHAKPEAEPPPEPRPNDWHEFVDLYDIEDESLSNLILSILSKHQDMWKLGLFGKVAATEHCIELEPDTKLIRCAPHRQFHQRRDIQAAQIAKMLEAGVIEPSSSEWASPVVLIRKNDGSLRFCIDYRRLNAKTVADAYPILRVHVLTVTALVSKPS